MGLGDDLHAGRALHALIRRSLLAGTCLAGLWLLAQSANAATFTVTTDAATGAGSLNQAIADANASAGADSIVFDAALAGRTINVGGSPLPLILDDVTIDGSGAPGLTISGGGVDRVFFVGDADQIGPAGDRVSAAIANMTIADGNALGGAGGVGRGGAGAGLGGAIFVSSTGDLTLNGVTFSDNDATGGSASATTVAGGGGGGMGGAGGSGGGAIPGGGGGFGNSATGGVGGAGAGGTFTGGASGGDSPIQVGGADGGGGGGGDFSNGGGGGGVGGESSTGANGGNGGFGGGGGSGGTAGAGGDGGFGGGGGGGVDSANGGDGGFGGGGGGGGGFGGSGGLAGFGGGAGAAGGGLGGGGAGMGGALFVSEGGSVVVSGDVTIDGGNVTGGTGFEAGSAFGSGLFLQGSGSITFAPGAEDTQTIADDIADQTGSGGSGTYATGGPSCTPGAATPCGSYSGSGSWSLVKAGSGTLILSGDNTYSGGTSINGGRLEITNANALGTGQVDIAGATLLSNVAGTYQLDNDFVFVTGQSSVFAAATGTAVQLTGFLDIQPNAIVTLGSSTAIGTIEFLPGAAINESATASVVIAGGHVIDHDDILVDQLAIGASTTVNAGATLDLIGNPFSFIRNLQGAGDIVIGSDFGFIPALQLNVDAGTASEFSGVISGDGSLMVGTTPGGPAGVAGRVILSGNNEYLGDTYICECSELQVGNGGTTGTIHGTVFNAGTLIFNRSDTYVVDNIIVDDLIFSGKVVQDGRGTVVLTAVNGYSGGTYLNNGIVSVSSEANLGDISGGLFFDGGILQVTGTGLTSTTRTITWGANGGGFDVADQGNTFTVSQQITGTGGLVKDGAGTLLLTGNNSYSGGTTILEGTLSLGSDTAAGTGAITTMGSVIDYANGITVANPIVINSNTTQLQVLAGTATQAGNISEAGGARPLEKIGDGTLVLSGTNSYTGGTTVTAGILQAGSAGAFVGNTAYAVNGGTLDLNGFDLTMSSLTGTGTVALGDGDLTLDSAANLTFSGVISGTGSFTKDGAGIFTLTGNSTYTGPTTVAEGTLSVNGAIVSPVTVENGATLAGNGFVGATVLNGGGTVAPGNSVGTLTVGGSLAFLTGSTYQVEIDGASADLITVVASAAGAGTASLTGGTVAANFLSTGDLQSRYLILTAAGGLGGTTFAALTDNLEGVDTTLTYEGTNVYIDNRVTLDQLPGLTLNQQAVADALTAYFNANGTLPLAFAALDAEGLTLASGELGTGAIQSGFIASDRFLSIISDRLSFAEGSQGGSSTATAYAAEAAVAGDAVGAYAALLEKRSEQALAARFDGGWKAWGSAYGTSANADGDAVVVGSHDLETSLWGLAAGAGWRDGNTAFGAALGGGHSSFDLDGGLGSGDADLFNAGLYGRADFGQAYLIGALAYGYHDVSTSRSVDGDVLEANYGAHSFSGRLETGYRFDTPIVDLTPYAAFQGTALSIPSYSETYAGTGTFALDYDGTTATLARGELGLHLDKTIPLQSGLLTLSGRAAWAHSSDSDNSITAAFQALPGTSFTVIGADEPEDSALLDLGAAFAFNNGVSASLAFQGQFADGYSAYSGAARLSIKW